MCYQEVKWSQEQQMTVNVLLSVSVLFGGEFNGENMGARTLHSTTDQAQKLQHTPPPLLLLLMDKSMNGLLYAYTLLVLTSFQVLRNAQVVSINRTSAKVFSKGGMYIINALFSMQLTYYVENRKHQNFVFEIQKEDLGVLFLSGL